MNDLKPCPFCGSDEISIVRTGTSRQSSIVECQNCGCRLEANELRTGSAWNGRAGEEKLEEEIRAVQEKEMLLDWC